jgi:hypothetical protein
MTVDVRHKTEHVVERSFNQKFVPSVHHGRFEELRSFRHIAKPRRLTLVSAVSTLKHAAPSHCAHERKSHRIALGIRVSEEHGARSLSRIPEKGKRHVFYVRMFWAPFDAVFDSSCDELQYNTSCAWFEPWRAKAAESLWGSRAPHACSKIQSSPPAFITLLHHMDHLTMSRLFSTRAVEYCHFANDDSRGRRSAGRVVDVGGWGFWTSQKPSNEDLF